MSLIGENMYMVLGIFSSRDYAESAISDLESQGFSPKDISVIMKDKKGESQNRSPSIVNDAATGATTGGMIGGLAGLLVGIGAITVPGIGAILIGGPLAASLGLTGAAATTVSGALTGALAGGLVGTLVGLGLPEEEAREYESRIKEGAILIAVPAHEEEEQKVREMLRHNRADIVRVIVEDRLEPREYSSQFPHYGSSNYPYEDKRTNEDVIYYSDIRPNRSRDRGGFYEEYFEENPDTESNRAKDEETKNTFDSLKEKLKKLFS